MTSPASPDGPSSAAALAAWRTHNRWLCLYSLGSLVAAAITWRVARGPDRPDPFYVAVAIEFAAWASINLAFGVRGAFELRGYVDGPAERGIDKARAILRLLRFNRWLNALWLSMGVALLAWSAAAGSAGLAGHGVGVLFQALSLAIADEGFIARLRKALGRSA